jgi:2-polyprenyl-6-methoxyphenol hydroxylase-like FAD-dependent oxidoreductase
VIVVDRDDLTGTGPRKGVPQGHHAHGILAKGREILEELFPGLTDELTWLGATAVDLVSDIAWFHDGRLLSAAPSNLLAVAVSRPTLENYLLARVGQLTNVEVRSGHEAVGLRTGDDRRRVDGVHLVPAGGGAVEELGADLVVDATGRGNRSATWLAELGYARPIEETVAAQVAYASRQYARRGPLPSGYAGAINSLSPSDPHSMVLIPIEGDRWMLTLVGIGHDIPPTDPQGFDEFAHRFPITDLHHVVENAEPLTEPRRFRAPASVRRRFERLARVPAGYLVIGDALCAFNPVYGQGMTVAAAEAMALRDCLRESHTDLPRRFYAHAARVIDTPWELAAGGDLAVPTTIGKRTTKIRVLNAYVARLLNAAKTDPVVALAFHETINLTRRPENLFAPDILRRVLFPRRAVQPATNSHLPAVKAGAR